MVEARIGQSTKSRVAPRLRVVGRIRVSGLLAVSEAEFAKLIVKLEKDPLFVVLSRARNAGERVLSYSPAPQTSLSPRFYEELKPEMSAADDSLDVQGFLRERDSVLNLVRKIGQSRFEEHFLYARSGKTLAEAARECGLSPEEAESINRFLLEFSSRAEFFNPSGLHSSFARRTTLVGQIVKGKDLSVAFFSPHLARGRYLVNEAALKGWFNDQPFDKVLKARARKLIENIRLFNIRHSAFFRVLSKTLQLQKAYLDSRDIARMTPASAESVSHELGLSPSTVSRAIGGKTLLLPWGTETAISGLLPGRHKALLVALKKVLEGAPRPLSDSELVEAVYQGFRLKASRRSINACRHELKRITT